MPITVAALEARAATLAALQAAVEAVAARREAAVDALAAASGAFRAFEVTARAQRERDGLPTLPVIVPVVVLSTFDALGVCPPRGRSALPVVRA